MDPALHDLALSVLELVRGLAHLVIDSPMTALLLLILVPVGLNEAMR
jgi:hypothetical protein